MRKSTENEYRLCGVGDKPAIRILSRRQFLTLSATAVGTAGAATLIGCGVSRQDSIAATIRLPDVPSQNPAYRAWLTRDGGLLLSTRTASLQVKAYGMNSNGRAIWRLCDGTRSTKAIAMDYQEQTGRPGTEVEGCLEVMMRFGVVVAGLHIVPAGRFPRPPAGGCYHMQTADA